MKSSNFFLTWRAFQHRPVTVVLTVASLALSVCLFLTVEKAREASEKNFSEAISQVDLLVGARSGSLQLLLYTLFDMGQPSGNVSIESFEEISKNPSVQWTIPFSLGDGHRGFRTVGTNENFFEHYRFRQDQRPEFQEGVVFSSLWDVVLGATVARELKYHLGSPIVISHGVTREEGLIHHDNRPFKVVGILRPTGTPLDRSLFISLESMEALHFDWESGAPPREGLSAQKKEIDLSQIRVKSITSFFLRTKNRLETLQLQRAINTYKEEPLMALIPGATLSELWRGLSFLEMSLRIISFFVLLIGFFSMMIVMFLSLEERRREMSIHRALGARPRSILSLSLTQSFLLTVLGLLTGFLAYFVVVPIFHFFLAEEFNFYLNDFWPARSSYMFSLFVLGSGILFGLFPAWRSQKLALKDGLSLKV
jgi:putative ABC transport system permease protein